MSSTTESQAGDRWPEDNDLSDGPKRKLLLSTLLGFCIGFLIGAAILVLIRVMESETDGMNALIAALAIFVPAVLLAGAAWFFSRGGEPRPLHWPLTFLSTAIGLGIAAMLWFSVPTEDQVAQAYLDEHRDLLVRRANQFAEIKELVESIPVGSLTETITEDQNEALKATEMDFRKTDRPRKETWNALLTCEADYARVQADTDPDTIMDRYDRPTPKFLRGDRNAYAADSEVDKTASHAFGDGFYWGIWELEELVEDAEKVRYVVYVRVANENLPTLDGNQFSGGFRSAEAFVYDLEAGELISAFNFAATNSDQVEYQYAENSGISGQTSSAMNSVIEDLGKNLWPAFWNRLHEVAPKTKSEHADLELPFKPVGLAEAFLNWKRKVDENEAKAKEVQAELEAQGLKPEF